MGRALAEAASGQGRIEIVALVGPNAPDWSTPLPWRPNLDALPAGPDLVIDFSLPEGTAAAAAWCGRTRTPLLSGVTGLPAAVREALQYAAAGAPVLWSPNLSLGVNLLAELAERAARVLDADTPVLIDDLHHQWKKDAPSGTALMLGAAIDGARGGSGRGIEYRSRREGEAVGEHTVRFRLAGEELELVHRANDRGIFARGAWQAGLWLVEQQPGLYTARDWLAGR